MDEIRVGGHVIVNKPVPAPHLNASYQPEDVAYEAAGADDSDDLDLLADRRFKPTRLTLVLVALIGVALVFGGGVLVQKHYGTSSFAVAGQAQAGTAGGFRQRGGAPAGTGQPGTVAASIPVVVGTIAKIYGSVLTVKNFAGKSVKVTVPQGVTVTLVAGRSLTGLETGSSISVAGTKNPDGSVKASAIRVTGR